MSKPATSTLSFQSLNADYSKAVDLVVGLDEDDNIVKITAKSLDGSPYEPTPADLNAFEQYVAMMISDTQAKRNESQ